MGALTTDRISQLRDLAAESHPSFGHWPNDWDGFDVQDRAGDRLRVAATENHITLYRFDQFQVLCWTAEFGELTPFPVIRAAFQVALRELVWGREFAA